MQNIITEWISDVYLSEDILTDQAHRVVIAAAIFVSLAFLAYVICGNIFLAAHGL